MKTVFICFALPVVLMFSCKENINKEQNKLTKENIKGETMGTTFSVSYLDSNNIDPLPEMEQLLLDFNSSVSTYISDSEISKFNQGDSLWVMTGGHFYRNFMLAKDVYDKSDAWFNPAVMPLVNYWGFGYTSKKIVADVDSSKVKELKKLIQFDSVSHHISGNQCLFFKKINGLELDFSAIAKGDAVDEVGRLLESKGIYNYFVEIGGEIRARGKTVSGYYWRTGIRVPDEKSNNNEMQLALELKDLSVATSGNYENFFQDKTSGLKYAHTINPHTGYPEKNSLLSASVFAKDCATADAFATAFMAMGLEKSWKMVHQLSYIDACFIYSDDIGNVKIKYSEKISDLMELNNKKSEID
jgi:FAD:protein FMN transferase